MKFSLLTIALAAAALASASASPLVRMESSHAGRDLPTGWFSSTRTDESAKLELVFAVKQQRVAELERTLLSVSDPDNVAYVRFQRSERAYFPLIAARAPTNRETARTRPSLRSSPRAWDRAST